MVSSIVKSFNTRYHKLECAQLYLIFEPSNGRTVRIKVRSVQPWVRFVEPVEIIDTKLSSLGSTCFPVFVDTCTYFSLLINI